MFYYEVWVATRHYHGSKPLIYSSDDRLIIGSVVVVKLQAWSVLGVVIKKASRPGFKTKTIARTIGSTPLPSEQLALIEWLRNYYPAPMGNLLQAFLPSSLLQNSTQKSILKDRSCPQAETAPVLTPQQNQAVWAVINHSATTYMLHGDTGTGKTRVYGELVRDALKKGMSSVVMTPEIGLTPQLAANLSDQCGDCVLVLHSMLPPAQRRDTWLKVLKSSRPLVVVGTRSALFSPVSHLGLIIMDEAHDSAYKQEQAPCYQTSRVAAKLASLHGAKLVMGSATPSVSDYYTLIKKKSPIIRMSTPAIANTQPPKTELVRVNDRANFSRSPYLSNVLIKRVNAALESEEQSLIFLNRRGTARVILCSHCGWQALCPNCDTALTYHGDKHQTLCHICAYRQAAPADCSRCHNPDIVYKGIGTKYLVQEVSRLFPGATIQRFDTDNKKTERLEQHYRDIVAGKVDILIGTQLLSKGLDLPKLSVIGVILADTNLLMPDYTANEATYQQLYQLIGRVGRGHRPGHAIVQSYHPDNPAIQAAIKRDYDAFYKREIEERQLFRFPPFCYLLKLECKRASRASAKSAAQKVADRIRGYVPQVDLAGPGPAFRERVSGKYRWQLIIKSKRRELLIEIIKSLPSGWSYDIDPANLL